MERFWSDDFDMDLLKLFPDLPDRLGDTANTPLWTYGNLTYGRLNHPSVWNSHAGTVAYFGTDDTGRWKPEGYVSHHDQIIECTWLEALRDAWPHTYLTVVNGHRIWDAHRLWPTFHAIMSDLRGWRPLRPGKADALRGAVLASILRATDDLTTLTARSSHG